MAGDVTNSIQAGSEHHLQFVQTADVSLEVLGRRRNVFPSASRLVVDHHDAVAILDQAIGQMRADKTCSSCNQDVHTACSPARARAASLATGLANRLSLEQTHSHSLRIPVTLSTSGFQPMCARAL